VRAVKLTSTMRPPQQGQRSIRRPMMLGFDRDLASCGIQIVAG